MFQRMMMPTYTKLAIIFRGSQHRFLCTKEAQNHAQKKPRATKSAARRSAFRERLRFLRKRDCVYVDESEIDAFLSRKRGHAPRGEKVFGEVAGRRFVRQSFVAGKCGRHILAPITFQGTCNTLFFEAWIEKILAPELRPGQTVMKDNASFHKSAKTRELIGNAA